MKIYLASRYSRHKELQQYAKSLKSDGFQITSRWIWGDHQIDDQGLSIEAKQAERERFALEDYEDLLNADLIINFTEIPRSCNSRGGRHVEYGIALGMRKKIIVIGPCENVFHCLPGVTRFDSFEEARPIINEAYE